MPRRTLQSAALVLAAIGAEPAVALEYCVTCEGPPAIYRCVIDGTPDGPGKDPTASLHCITRMARQGAHETCAVARGAPFPCPGLTAAIEPPPAAPALAAPPSVGTGEPAAVTETPGSGPAPDTAPAAAAAPEPAEEPARVPRTVEELAGQTVRSSQRGLEKAGEAIGGTAKKAGEQIGNAGTALGSAASKTWTCLTSFFNDCSGAPEADPSGEPPDARAPLAE